MSFSNNSTKPATAVILAGGDASDRLASHQGAPAKAHVKVGGRSLADLVMTAVAEATSVDRIVFVGSLPADVRQQPDATVPSGKLFSDSVALGLGAALGLDPEAPLLLCTCDLPWLTGAAIDRFVGRSTDDLNYPIISREVALKDFPGQERTWVKLKQGQVTGGNLALIQARVVPDLLLLTDRFFRARKNPLALSSLVGFGTLIDLLLGRADLPSLETRVSALLGHQARAVWAEDASLGADVDKPEQLPAD